jgi:hypothetical protein
MAYLKSFMLLSIYYYKSNLYFISDIDLYSISAHRFAGKKISAGG